MEIDGFSLFLGSMIATTIMTIAWLFSIFSNKKRIRKMLRDKYQ